MNTDGGAGHRWAVGGLKERHLTEAALHGYVAGEVDPPTRAAVETHLALCTTCQARHRNVQTFLDVVAQARAPDLDELAWRRVRERVRVELENQAAEGATTLDLLVGRRWVPAAAAGLVAVLALAIIGAYARPKNNLQQQSLQAQVSDPKKEAPAEVELHLGQMRATAGLGTELSVTADGPLPKLQLRAGTLRLVSTAEGWSPIQIESTAGTVVTQSRAATINVFGDELVLAVQEGWADVETYAGKERVDAGRQGRWRARAQPVEPQPVSLETKPTPEPKAQSLEVKPKPLEVKPLAPVTTVEVIEPDDDAVSAAWRSAARAFYAERDFGRALTEADKVVRLGGDRPEVQMARKLACEAAVAAEQPRRAVVACSALLAAAGPTEQRALHLRLGTIHRVQLNDCRSALAHYGQVLVFGKRSLLDDEVRLWRAHCALEVGELDLVERDLRFLEQPASASKKDASVEGLRRRFEDARRAQLFMQKAE